MSTAAVGLWECLCCIWALLLRQPRHPVSSWTGWDAGHCKRCFCREQLAWDAGRFGRCFAKQGYSPRTGCRQGHACGRRVASLTRRCSLISLLKTRCSYVDEVNLLDNSSVGLPSCQACLTPCLPLLPFPSPWQVRGRGEPAGRRPGGRGARLGCAPLHNAVKSVASCGAWRQR